MGWLLGKSIRFDRGSRHKAGFHHLSLLSLFDRLGVEETKGEMKGRAWPLELVLPAVGAKR